MVGLYPGPFTPAVMPAYHGPSLPAIAPAARGQTRQPVSSTMIYPRTASITLTAQPNRNARLEPARQGNRAQDVARAASNAELSAGASAATTRRLPTRPAAGNAQQATSAEKEAWASRYAQGAMGPGDRVEYVPDEKAASDAGKKHKYEPVVRNPDQIRKLVEAIIPPTITNAAAHNTEPSPLTREGSPDPVSYANLIDTYNNMVNLVKASIKNDGYLKSRFGHIKRVPKPTLDECFTVEHALNLLMRAYLTDEVSVFPMAEPVQSAGRAENAHKLEPAQIAQPKQSSAAKKTERLTSPFVPTTERAETSQQAERREKQSRLQQSFQDTIAEILKVEPVSPDTDHASRPSGSARSSKGKGPEVSPVNRFGELPEGMVKELTQPSAPYGCGTTATTVGTTLDSTTLDVPPAISYPAPPSYGTLT